MEASLPRRRYSQIHYVSHFPVLDLTVSLPFSANTLGGPDNVSNRLVEMENSIGWVLQLRLFQLLKEMFRTILINLCPVFEVRRVVGP
jgi:hypothetical protein